jgi:hypothetical protein
MDAWLEKKFPDFGSKKLDALYQADDEWERMGTNKYEALEVFQDVSKTGGEAAHMATAGDIADALLRQGRPTDMKHLILSAMLQDLVSHTSEEIIQNKELKKKVVDGSSRKLKNMVRMREKAGREFREEAARVRASEILQESESESELELIYGEKDFVFAEVSKLSDNSSDGEEGNESDTLSSVSSGSKKGFFR